MPIYDFRCEECGKRFSDLVSWRDKDRVTCPECGSSRVKDIPAAFGLGGGGSSSGGSSSGSCGSRGFS